MFATIFLVLLCLLSSGRDAAAGGRLLLGSTTSLDNTGLFEVLNPPFEKANDCRVEVVAVGSGKALELGRRGDVDALFLHSPPEEIEFVRQGHGTLRKVVMKNRFLVVGPPDDPAGVGKTSSAAAAFEAIARSGALFVSRGDDSGTHRKELSIWKETGIVPGGPWYIEVGQGMGVVLEMADQKRAYTLVDLGTFVAFSSKVGLVTLFEGDPVLENIYSVMAVDPSRHPGVAFDLAKRYVEWVDSAEGRRIIAEFGRKRFGRPIFELVGVGGNR